MKYNFFTYLPALLFIGGILAFAGVAAVSNSVHTLTVQKSGTGNGTVFDDSKKISCGETCAMPYDLNQILTLTAVPASDTSLFGGWLGPCATILQNLCVVQMDSDKTVVANFALDSTKILFPLSINLDGIGSVTSSPEGIRCGSVQPEGSVCVKEFSIGRTVTLTATSNPGSTAVFSDWSGACLRVSGNTCSVFMDSAKVVTAKFAYPPLQTAHPLSVTVRGGGSVVSEDNEIFCDQKNVSLKCTKAYLYGRSILLIARPSSSESFDAWIGNCSAVTDGRCLVQIDGPKTITATFQEIPQQKSLAVISYGPGSVRSDKTGILCPSDCAEEFARGASVVLSANPQAGAMFLGWKGACKGQEPCVVALDKARFVYARFRFVNAMLSVKKNGFGTVTSVPTGLVCGNVCSASYPTDTVVTLYATPLAGQVFSRWEGADTCKGKEPRCTVPMGANQSVTAVFVPSSAF